MLPKKQIVLVGFNRRLLNAIVRSGRYQVTIFEEPELIQRRNVREVVAELSTTVELVPMAYQLNRVDEAVLAQRPVPHGVIPSNEYAVRAAAQLTEYWGLPGAGQVAARYFTNKLALREVSETCSFVSPLWREIKNSRELDEFVSAWGPSVLKPASSQASIGVQFVDAGDDADQAWRRVVSAADGRQRIDEHSEVAYIAESRMHGQEVSIETLVSDGEVLFSNLTDKHIQPGVHPVEIGHDVPSRHSKESVLLATRELIQRTGFRTGFLHTEWMLLPDGRVGLIESAARTAGDSIMLLIEAAYGFDTYMSVVDVVSGANPDLVHTPISGAAIRFMPASAGVFDSLAIAAELQRYPGSPRITQIANRGDKFAGSQSTWDRVAQVICSGVDGTRAGKHADAVISRLVARYRADA